MIYNFQVRLNAVNFARTQATCANVHVFYAAGGSADFNFLDVGRPTASCFSITMADGVAAHSAFTANTANSGHNVTS